MADDGMDLNINFSVTAPPPVSHNPLSVKGGRWTERLKAKRATKNRLARSSKPATDAPPESNRRSAANSSLKRKRPGDNSGEPRTTKPPPGADGTFVSSLWTGNPEAVTTAEERVEETTPQEPSNAPLADGSSTFTTLGLSPILANHLTTKLGLKAPTAIQRSAIPDLLSTDSDAFIQAQTGSGKTLTFVLPIVDRIMRITATEGRRSGLYAIILAPTRELSQQIYTVLQSLVHCKNGPHWIVPGQIKGGEKKKAEKARIRKGMNILVATPGRLLDHMETTESLRLDAVRWLVLDEGDRLMDLGFEEDINKILNILETRNRVRPDDGPLPNKRVTVLCSATMKTNVQKLGEKSLKDALYIKAEPTEEGGEEASEESKFTAPAQLKQSYVIVPAKLRLVTLYATLKRAFIRQTAKPKILVFFSCSDSVNFHYEVFTHKDAPEADTKSKNQHNNKHSKSTNDSKSSSTQADKSQKNVPAASPAVQLRNDILLHKLHGSLAQDVRTATLASFTKTKNPAILFCTDVAARGLDLPDVDLVVQFDPPFSPDDHLHRIGRTARAGRDGKAVMFLLPGPEEGYVDAVLKKGIREGQLSRAEADTVIEKGLAENAKEKRRDWEDRATEWQLNVERWIMDDSATKDLASKAWTSHVRAYTTHVGSEKAIFNHKALHFGHLAKSFGLRETPSSIKAPSADAGKGGKGKAGGKGKRKFDMDDISEQAGDEGMKKMRQMARAMERKGGLSSEFNIG
ncbi:ATP-dependent RNA helicase dbp7 [Ascodesmis nigricans]|uniref:ATP-dependent RNA helicase n=1 Tax=Ascodesmis nigricans TaxID=341454 RepID=A0A4S2N2B7_9PEZI|nr:ATP-dependent RNA helicase dbp7 [Ascodesmis nigricans]